jgi:hypothetical protein
MTTGVVVSDDRTRISIGMTSNLGARETFSVAQIAAMLLRMVS